MESRLSLFLIDNADPLIRLKVIRLTVLTILNRQKALNGIIRLLIQKGADSTLIDVCKRDAPPPAFPPPNSETIEDGHFYKQQQAALNSAEPKK